MKTIKDAGFEGVELLSRVDVFQGANGEVRARAFGTEGVNIRAVKPESGRRGSS